MTEKYFVYDSNNGFEIFDNYEDAVKFFNETIEICREEGHSGGEWDDDVEQCFMGKITHKSCLIGDNDCEGFALVAKDLNTGEIIDNVLSLLEGDQ